MSIAPVSEQRDALHYAPPPPLRRRRVFRRVAFLLALLISVGAGIHWLPLLREHVALQVCQRQCLNHVAPPDEVVFEPDPQRAKQLLADPRYQGTLGPAPCAFLVPQEWLQLYATLSPPGMKSDGTLFLGRMNTPDGRERLVAIDLTWNRPVMVSMPTFDFLLTARVIEPGRLLTRPRLLSSYTKRFSVFGEPVAVAAATRDPQDASHLVLLNYRVDASLKDDDKMVIVPQSDRRVGDTSWIGRFTPPAPSSPASLPTSGRPAARPSASPASR